MLDPVAGNRLATSMITNGWVQIGGNDGKPEPADEVWRGGREPSRPPC
jgi:hypothetical protein